jgi:putative hydrolase of the HAD superfamily
MSKKRYSHIFFDLDNTLWDFHTNSFHALHTVFQKFPKLYNKIDFTQFFNTYSKHNHELWEAYKNKKVVKKELVLQRFQKTFSELNISAIDAAEMNSLYLSEMPKQRQLVEGAIELLDYLTAKGYLLLIITNGFREVQLKKLEETGLSKYFNKVFISEDVQSPKPHRQIFEYAVKSSNASKSKSLMVGDDWEVDIKGATDFGIDAVFFKANNQNDEQQVKLIKQNRNLVYSVNMLKDMKSVL